MADTETWQGVASNGVSTLPQLPEGVQYAVVIVGGVVAMAIIAALFFRRQRDDSTVPAAVMISVTEEFSRQVAHMTTAIDGLALVVEDMRDTVKGCSTCSYNPHGQGRRS